MTGGDRTHICKQKVCCINSNSNNSMFNEIAVIQVSDALVQNLVDDGGMFKLRRRSYNFFYGETD